MAQKFNTKYDIEPFKAESNDGADAYDEYLLLLQQRNRLLKKLKKKDEKQLELERKEQGFSLFFTGANVGLQLSGNHKSRKMKTAGVGINSRNKDSVIDPRARTAPSNPLRKGWNQFPPEELKIKTDSGDKVDVNIPELISGNYCDDFEPDESFAEEADDDACQEDDEDDDSQSYFSDEFEDDEEENKLQLTFTIEDAKALRQSLQRDCQVMKSMEMSLCEIEPSESSSDEMNELSEREEASESEDDNGENDISEELVVEDVNDNDDSDDDIPMTPLTSSVKFQAYQRQSRPVSAINRRHSEQQKEPELSPDLLRALEEENRLTDTRKVKTAPELKSTWISSSNNDDDAPSSCLTDSDLSSITHQVRKMSGRQQRKLLSLLADLEAPDCKQSWDGDGTGEGNKSLSVGRKNREECWSENTSKINEKTSNDSKKNPQRHPKKTPLDSLKDPKMAPFDSLKDPKKAPLDSLRDPKKAPLDSLKDPKKAPLSSLKDTKKETLLKPSLHGVDVVLQFLSNWGNESYIGFTELEFMHINGHLVTLSNNNIKLLSSHVVLTDINNAVNLSKKTTNGRNMVKFRRDFTKDLKVQVCLPLQSSELLSKVIVWNYNQSLQDLNIGVKHCRLYVAGELKWQGVIDKGCGNQMFDYCHVITLREVVEGDRCQTRTLSRSDMDPAQLPIISRPSSTSNNSGKPSWLEDTVPSKMLVVDDSPKRTRSRPSSGRRSQLNNECSNDEDKLKKDTEELESLFDLSIKPKRVQSGRRSGTSEKREKSSPLLSPLPPSSVDMQSGMSETKVYQRQRFKDVMDVNLEESLRSIDNFKHHHLGRIQSNLDDDGIFGSFLEPMNQEDINLLHKTFDDPMEDSKENEIEELFQLPVLPCGQELIINIKTTWGDCHYVGLNGIEVFTSEGTLAEFESINAVPKDINILPEYEGDPRVVENLIDGCYLTRDDMHLWLAPFTPGSDHLVVLQFKEPLQVALIRIWNYNKSRIHSLRGACFVEMALDGKLIFIGEIARASGVLSSDDPYGDTILFTTDEEILALVAFNDASIEMDDDEKDKEDLLALTIDNRPKTGDKSSETGPVARPFTCPKSRYPQVTMLSTSFSIEEEDDDDSEEEENIENLTCRADVSDGFHQCQELSLFFGSTWGDQHYMGLTGLEVLGETFETLSLTIDMLEAVPRDLNDLEEYNDDDRTLDKLIDGVNVSTSDENMWMIPFNEEGTHLLKITFSEPTVVTGVRVWNYNKSLEDTFRGAKSMFVYMDDKEVSPPHGFLLRKGPGHCHFDYAQDIIFNVPQSLDNEPVTVRHRKINLQKVVNEYETMVMPRGFVFQLKLLSSWGDMYYIGLNGVQVFDGTGKEISLTDNNITAYPHSVNVLDGVSDDVRTPDKLIDGVYNTYDGCHMWLAPVLPNQANFVYIVFDEPMTVSMIKLWNYSKTPTRGVRQFGLLVDDLLVYSGVLPRCHAHARAIVPGLHPPLTHYTMLFTDVEAIALKEKSHILSSNIEEQKVQLTNERSVLNPLHEKKDGSSNVDPALRPKTSVKLPGRHQR